MVNLLSTSLDGAGELRSSDPRALLALVRRENVAVPEPRDAREMAGRLGARYYVLGSVVEAGDSLRVDAAIYDVQRGADAVANASAMGTAGQLFSMVDRLAAQLLAASAPGSQSRATRIAAVTTSSLPALKAYLEGEREFRAGRYQPATEAFQRAVAIDSQFALGFYRLSIAAEWAIRPDVARSAAAQAVRHADRLAEHDRALLDALLDARLGRVDEAERRYLAITASYPDDVEAWLQLSEVQFHYGPLYGRPLTDAREAQLRVLGFEPDNAAVLLHLARVEAAAGNRAAVDSLAAQFVQSSPGSDRVLEIEVLRAALGDSAELQRGIALLDSASAVRLPIGLFGALNYTVEPEGSRRLAATLDSPDLPPSIRAWALVQLAFLDVQEGRWRSAQERLAEAARYDAASAMLHRALLTLAPFRAAPQAELNALQQDLAGWNAAAVAALPVEYTSVSIHNGLHERLKSYLQGLVAARLGSDDAALQHAASLEQSPDSVLVTVLFRPLARGLRSAALERRGDHARALQALGQLDVHYEPALFSPFYSRALERFRRARLLDTLGRHEEAARFYSSFRDFSLLDRIYEAPAAYYLGLMRERQGQREQARQAFRLVVERWGNADPEFQPIVRDARRRLES